MSDTRLLIDVDGVICDFIEAFMALYRSHYGVVPEDFVWDDWASMEKLPDQHIVKDVWLNPDLFLLPRPYPGAIEALERLNEAYDVRIVTDVPHIHVFRRSDWFKRHAPFIHRKNQIIFTNDKSAVRGDFIIDDHLPHVHAWMKVNGDTGVVIDQPWNQEGGEQRYVRIHSLKEFAEMLGLGGKYE